MPLSVLSAGAGRPQAVVTALLSLTLALSRDGAAEAVDQRSDSIFGHCIGDCSEDGRVTIDEIIRGVRIALGEAAPDLCGVGGPGPGFGIDGLVTAVLNSLEGCTTLHDLSGFEEFAYTLTPAFGFCPPLGAVHDAVIHRSGDTYVLKRSIVDTGTPGIDDCLPEYLTGRPCLVVRSVPCQALTAEEVQRINDVFGQITVWTAADSFCLFGVEDPCLIRTVRWDDLQTTDAICAASRLDYEQRERLRALVESLGKGPEMACDGVPPASATPTPTLTGTPTRTHDNPPPTATATPTADAALTRITTTFAGLCGPAPDSYVQITEYGYYGFCSSSGSSYTYLRIERFDDIAAAGDAFAQASLVGPPYDFEDLPAAYWERGFASPNDGGTRTMAWQLDCWVVTVRSFDNYGGRLALAPQAVSQAIFDAAAARLTDRCVMAGPSPTPTPTKGIGPDLVVSGVGALAHNETCQPFATLDVCVANAGRVAAGEFAVTVAPGGDRFSLPGLQPGAEQCSDRPFPSPHSFSQLVTIEVDADNQVNEIDEGNNSLSVPVFYPSVEATCRPTPMPTVTPPPSH